MPRIAGVDIPRNKQIRVSLQYIHGIGSTLSQKILAQTDINPDAKADGLTEEEVNRLRELIDHEYRVEGELRKEVTLTSGVSLTLVATGVLGIVITCQSGGNEREPMLVPSVVLAKR